MKKPSSRQNPIRRDSPNIKLRHCLSYASFLQPKTTLNSAWIEHTPFAIWLTEIMQPKLFVELGTLHGVSYFTFCESIARLGLAASAYAIDTWEGDEHTGFYGNDVIEHVRLTNLQYASFSTLVHKTFDDAVHMFADGSIDLLHIDGRHYYDDVRHDFHTYFPKLSNEAIVLFHDTNVYERGFGVSRLWNELSKQYPSFEFLHGNGLGVLRVGKNVTAELDVLFAAGKQPDELVFVRNAYSRLGGSVSQKISLQHEQSVVTRLSADIATIQANRISLGTEVEALRAEINAAKAAVVAVKAEREFLLESVNNLERQNEGYRNSFARTKQALFSPVSYLVMGFRNLLRRDRAETYTLQRLESAGVFDREWYLAQNPDVAASGMDPLLHFVLHGATEGRAASPLFNTRDYLQRYPDVAASGLNPLLHYYDFGAKEGRSPGSAIDQVGSIGDYPVVGEACDVSAYMPLMSIIMPVYNIAPKWLNAAILSVQSQSYLRWEMCICDDGSTNAETIAALTDLERSDARIHVVHNDSNQGISAATNAALSLASGDFVAFLDNDDELVPRALEMFVRAINTDATIDILYSDEDKISATGRYEEPYFKPDWSPLLLREVMYVGHLLVARHSLVKECGGLDGTYDGVQDFELALRLSERARSVVHVRHILYHWRRLPGSVADKSDAKPGLGKLQVAAVNAHLRRIGLSAQAIEHPKLQHRVVIVPNVRIAFPKISIVIPTRDAPKLIARCLDSIFENTAYPNFEVVVVDNGTTNQEALSAIAKHQVKRVDYFEEFNYSHANNIGVAAANGEILVLLNNDTEVDQGDWLEQMLHYLDDPKVSVVGPRLVYPNGKIQHAGVALGIRGTADHVLRGLPADADGYFGSLSCSREVSAVTFACAMMRRTDYLYAGGLEELFSSHYQDVDLCLRIRSAGGKIVFTPRATVVHHESATRGTKYDMIDRMLLLDRWGSTIALGDPYSRWEHEARDPVIKK